MAHDTRCCTSSEVEPMSKQALARIERLCRERGVRLTPQRRRVMQLLLASDRPLGAYELIKALDAHSERTSRTAPPTVYRALDFLLEQGFVHRIASLQAFASCIEPENEHSAQFLVCTDCGRADEVIDSRLEASVATATRARGFADGRHAVEVTCRCQGCEHGGAGR
jgi:Fur family zinc uptake transcriptional regulator